MSLLFRSTRLLTCIFKGQQILILTNSKLRTGSLINDTSGNWKVYFISNNFYKTALNLARLSVIPRSFRSHSTCWNQRLGCSEENTYDVFVRRPFTSRRGNTHELAPVSTRNSTPQILSVTNRRRDTEQISLAAINDCPSRFLRYNCMAVGTFWHCL